MVLFVVGLKIRAYWILNYLICPFFTLYAGGYGRMEKDTVDKLQAYRRGK